MIELIRHTTKSGKQSPFWLVVIDELESFKVASLDCAKRLIAKFTKNEENYASRTEGSETFEYCGKNRDSEIRDEKRVLFSSELRVDSVSPIFDGIYSPEEGVDSGNGNICVQSSISGTMFGTGTSEFVEAIRVELQHDLHVGLSIGGNSSIEEGSNDDIHGLTNLFFQRIKQSSQGIIDCNERLIDCNERLIDCNQTILKTVGGFIIKAARVAGVHLSDIDPRTAKALSIENERNITEHAVIY